MVAGQDRGPGRRVAQARWPLAAALVASLGSLTAHGADPQRWPLWPTEVRRTAEPLLTPPKARPKSERQRIAAIQALDAFATPVITDVVLGALADASPQVRREALRLCAEREIVACIPPASGLWANGEEPTVRIAALQVLALQPDALRVDALLDALRDPSEIIRAQAADFLGESRLTAPLRHRVRIALLAKLADVSITVRRRAVHSLGLLGGGEGTLSIARLLSDPEPTVRAAAAETLGRYRDPDAVPALRRALATPNESIVGLALIHALAVLPDPGIEADLLALLDDPPPGLNAGHVAGAIGRRVDPSPALAEGLLKRMSEPVHADAAQQGLLLLGEPARPAIEAALERGVAAPVEVQLRRLVAALDAQRPADSAADDALAIPTRWPSSDDRKAWQALLDGQDALSRRRAAWNLADRDPAWRLPHALALIAAPGSIRTRLAWVLTVAASPRPWAADDPSATEAATRLEGWARDTTVAAEHRCAAVMALGARQPSRGDRKPSWGVDLAATADPSVRGCTALVLGRVGASEVLASMLIDGDASVRTAAALGLGQCDPDRVSPATSARLALLGQHDDRGEVRAAARLASRALAQGQPLPSAPVLVQRHVDPYRWIEPARSIELRVGDDRIWVPALGSGAWRWALAPSLGSTVAGRDVEQWAPSAPATPRP